MHRALLGRAWHVVVLVIACGLTATFAQAQTNFDWNNPAGGNFSTPGNWTPIGPPSTTLHIARFPVASTYSVLFTSNVNIFRHTVVGGNVTWNLSGITFQNTDTISNGIGNNVTPTTLKILGGTFLPGNLSLATSADVVSTLTLEQGVDVTVGAGVFYVGTTGTGTLTIQTGATLTTTGGSAGMAQNSEGIATVTVTGAGSALTIPNTYSVAEAGNGTLIVKNGATAMLGGLDIASSPGGVGLVNVTAANSVLTSSGTTNIAGMTNLFPGASGTLTVGPAATVNLNGTTNLRTTATVNVNGGTLNLNTVNVTPGAVVNWSSGKINFASGASINGSMLDLLLAGTHTLGTNRTLSAAGGAMNLDTALSVNGGTLNVADLNINAPLEIGAFGTVSGTGLVTIGAGKSVQVEDFGTLGTAGTIINDGLLELHGPAATVTGFTANNFGTVQGTGRFAGGMNNGTGGTIRAREGDHLIIEQTGLTNPGRIEMSGGVIEYTKVLSNLANGIISGRGTFRGGSSAPGTNGLSNQGRVLLSGGISDIHGDVNNSGTGKVIVSGGAVATFHDDFTNNASAELRVSAGATAVFFGFVNNLGSITGSGTKLFEGGSSGTLGALATTGSTVVEDGASVQATHFREQSLTVNGDATVPANGGTTGMSVLNTLEVGPGGALDLNDNDLVVNSGDFATIYGLVLDGYENTTGIISSTSGGREILALFDNALIGAGSWNGQSIGANAIVGKYTYFGDANFDGQVTGDDYTSVDANLSTDPALGIEWLSGDMNLDGVVTGDDYTVIDAMLGVGVGNPLSPSAVPEPAAFGLIAIGMMMARRRVRKMAIVA